MYDPIEITSHNHLQLVKDQNCKACWATYLGLQDLSAKSIWIFHD